MCMIFGGKGRLIGWDCISFFRLSCGWRGGFWMPSFVLSILIVDPLPRADKRPSVGATSITRPAQLLTFRIFLFKPVELYQTTINSSYCDGILKH